jgi:hypothetical protein
MKSCSRAFDCVFLLPATALPMQLREEMGMRFRWQRANHDLLAHKLERAPDPAQLLYPFHSDNTGYLIDHEKVGMAVSLLVSLAPWQWLAFSGRHTL